MDTNVIEDDLRERSIDIHCPDDSSPNQAHLFAHNAIVIDVPVANICAKLVDAGSWPTWYSNAGDVVVNDAKTSLLRRCAAGHPDGKPVSNSLPDTTVGRWPRPVGAEEDPCAQPSREADTPGPGGG